MVAKVELIPISEGNRITVKQNEKVIVGRGSSLGCNDKKISRHHAELLFKDDNTLWIKPTHANPVFYRPSNGKTIQLPKDIERELKDGDQIGLLPSSFFFRVSFSTDLNNNNDNNDSDSDSMYGWKREQTSPPTCATSPDHWSAIRGFRRSLSNQDTSVFDFDEDVNIEPTRELCRRTSFDKKTISDVEKKSISDVEKKSISNVEKKSITSVENRSIPDVEKQSIPDVEKPTIADDDSKTFIPMVVPTISLTRVSIPSPSAEEDQDEPESESEPSSSDLKSRKLPKWMAGLTPSPVVKPTTTTPKSSYSRSLSSTAPTSAKRHLSFEGDSNSDVNESSNMSDVRSPTTPSETKSPGKVLSKIHAKSLDSNSGDELESIISKSPQPPTKKIRSGGKRRPICQFGATCYRKNPTHRTQHSHPGDSDYEDSKQSNDTDNNDDNDADKPQCPFGKTCYRQNPQHKLDFKH